MSEELDVKKYLRRVILVCWLALVVCFLIKLFGANIFEIICKNETFIQVCKYADTHLWANYLVSAVYCFVSLYFFTLAILQERKFKWWQLLIVILTVLGGTAIKIWNSIAGLFFDVWQFIIMPLIFLGKQAKSFWKILLANVLLVIFQLVSAYIKNVKFNDLYESAVLGMIYSIDVIIMLVLYYSYANIIKIKKESKENG